jgi:hypothetical protein
VYYMFVEEMNAIVGSSRMTDRIRFQTDRNSSGGGGPREWIEGMLCCDLGHINSILNQNSAFLDLIFSNASTDITVEICESPS